MDFLDARLVSIIHQQIYCWRLLEPDMLTSLTYTGYGLPMNMGTGVCGKHWYLRVPTLLIASTHK